MGKTINIEGSCSDEMFEEVDDDVCQTCPFNAMNGEAGCYFNYPDLIVDVLPGSVDDLGSDDQYVREAYGKASYAIDRLMKVGHHDSLVFTRDETLAMFAFFWNWEPPNEAKAEKYRKYLDHIMRIMRRAVLLGKGIVIGW